MRTVLNIFLRVVLFPVWIVLGAVQTVGAIVVNLGNTVFHLLSGTCFVAAVACVLLVGEPISDQKMVLIGGCVFGLLPCLSVGVLSAVAIVKMIVGEVLLG